MNDELRKHQLEQEVVTSVAHSFEADPFLPHVIRIMHQFSTLSAEQFSERVADLIGACWEGADADPHQMAEHLGISVEMFLRCICAHRVLVTGKPHGVVTGPAPNTKRN
jgi:hypothetical protein